MRADAEAVSAVIPWRQPFFRERFSRTVFAEINKQGIEASPERKPEFMGNAV